MDKDIIKRILSLDREFYQQYAESFSNSRRFALRGWLRVKEIIENDSDLNNKQSLSVTDLGAGNCRFYDFLTKHLKQQFVYLGIDQNEKLIEISKQKYGDDSKFKIKKIDIIQKLNSVRDKGDVVCAFGLTHHIPSEKLRQAWFSDLHKLVQIKGLLVLTFWDTKKTPVLSETIEMESGDKLLGWQGKPNLPRYVHVYSDDELSNITKSMEKNNLVLINSFIEDQNKSSHNKYLIFKRL